MLFFVINFYKEVVFYTIFEIFNKISYDRKLKLGAIFKDNIGFFKKIFYF